MTVVKVVDAPVCCLQPVMPVPGAQLYVLMIPSSPARTCVFA